MAWPGVLQARLGDDYHIVEEGLGGRTVVTESCIPTRRGTVSSRKQSLRS